MGTFARTSSRNRLIAVVIALLEFSCGGRQEATTSDGGALADAYASDAIGTADGGPATITTLPAIPQSLVSDGTNLFWIDSAGNVIRMSVAGGPLTTLATSANPHCLLADDENVYAITGNSVSVEIAGGDLYRIAKTGAAPARLADGSGSEHTLTAALRDGRAYWVDHGDASQNSSLRLGSVAGGSAMDIPGQLHIGNDVPPVMAVTSTAIFLTGSSSYYIPLTTTDGGTDFYPSSAFPTCASVAADGDTIYCGPSMAGSVAAIGADGSIRPLTESAYPVQGVAFDASYVYYLDGWRVMRVSKQGGDPVLLASEAGQFTAIAVDDQAVFWAGRDATIHRLAKTR